MRIMVFFDIPTEPESSKKEYVKFRRFLLDDGYLMMQYSVYSRFCKNDSDVKKHILRLEKYAPLVGNVRAIKITEAQFENMLILIGDRKVEETVVNRNSLTIIE